MFLRKTGVAGALALAICQARSQGVEAPSIHIGAKPLEPVVVTASRYQEEYRLVPSYVTYISQEDIAQNNIRTVNEAVIRLGGLAGRSSLGGGREQNLDMAGFGDAAQSNFIILIDGIPINESDSSEVRISGMPIESVRAIEIHRSAATSLYGGGGTGGVLNILTDLSVPTDAQNRSSSSYYIGAGSFSARDYRISAKNKSDNLTLLFSIAHQSEDGYRQQSTGRETTGFFSSKWNTPAASFGLTAAEESQNVRTPGPLSLTEFFVNPSSAQAVSAANNTYNDIVKQRLSGFVEWEYGENLFRIDGSLRSRDLDARAVQFNAPVRLNFSGQSDHLAFSFRRFIELRNFSNQILMGYEIQHWDQERKYSPAGPLGAKDLLDSESKSIFLKNDLDVKDSKTRFSIGYRSERNERSVVYEDGTRYFRMFDQQAFDFGVSQRLGENSVIYFKTSKGYRFANIDEFASAPSVPPLWIPIALRPQISRQIEVGFRRSWNSGARLQARVYQNKLQDEIIYDVLQYVNINLDPTRRVGIDLDGSMPVDKSVRVSATLSAREAQFSSGLYKGNQIPMSLPKVGLLGIDWQPVDKHRLGLDYQWVGSQYPSGDFRNEYRIPAYDITNLRYEYRASSLEVSLAIRNFFNRSFYSSATIVPRYDAVLGRSVFDYVGVYPDPGRNFWISVRLKF